MYGCSGDKGRFYKERVFTTLHRNQKTYRVVSVSSVVKSAVIKHHPLLTKVKCINEKLRFDQFAKTSSSASS